MYRFRWFKRLVVVLFLCGLPVGGVEVMKWPVVEEPSNSPLRIEGLFAAEGMFLWGIELTITNQGSETIVLLWDECSLVLPNRQSLRIIHTGVKYIEKEKPQSPTPIPPKTFVREAIWPTDYVEWVSSEWVELPIKIQPGDEMSVHLAWQDSRGKHYAAWTWRIPPLPEPPPSPEVWLSLSGIFNFWIPDVPIVIPWFVLSSTNYNKEGELAGCVGINIGLGISFRTFLTSIMQADYFSVYWGWGTVLLILPYVEIGVIYQTDRVAIDVGTWWIYPRVGLVIKF